MKLKLLIALSAVAWSAFLVAAPTGGHIVKDAKDWVIGFLWEDGRTLSVTSDIKRIVWTGKDGRAFDVRCDGVTLTWTNVPVNRAGD